ncbi:tetratricopeptide repeat protein [Actinoplanes subtropicus]|uniref:tetratricopeptide repeat protein n=1 Tax=Actinoplanes subtropicus TaxID=543632 RepID=UPI0004C429BD|nr:tetratricopeptide repeat protein [Actinoplanes subtropicus]
MGPDLDPETTPEEYRQRALLLADLGRYDEAAGEIAAGLSVAPDEPNLLATLARIHLAAEQPAEALVAADRAVAAAPQTLTTLVVRAMALTDSRRYADAARVASDILRGWPADAYAQRTGAALLSESRNGQAALNAAWNAVRVAPAEPEAHLVLAVVAARLQLFDLAQRAYAEALDLDPAIGTAQSDVGIVRFERRRWAQALEGLADDATFPFTADEPPPEEGPGAVGGPSPYPQPFPRPYQAPDRPEPETPPSLSSAGWAGEQAVSRPRGPVLDSSADEIATVRRGTQIAANSTLIAAVVAAAMATASEGISRAWAALFGLIIVLGVLIWLKRSIPGPLGAALARLRANHRWLAVALYLSLAAPLLLPVYALVGGVIPLIAGMLLAAVANMVVLTRR